MKRDDIKTMADVEALAEIYFQRSKRLFSIAEKLGDSPKYQRAVILAFLFQQKALRIQMMVVAARQKLMTEITKGFEIGGIISTSKNLIGGEFIIPHKLNANAEPSTIRNKVNT